MGERMPAQRNHITRITMAAKDPLVQAALQAHLSALQRAQPDARLLDTTITLVLRSAYLPDTLAAPLGIAQTKGNEDGDAT